MSLEIYIDGSSLGNPGPAGVGVVIYKQGKIVKNISKNIGEATNNIAEYMALIYALQEALIRGEKEISVNTDSELLKNQLTKKYKIKNSRLFGLYEQILHLFSGFNKIKIKHISRNSNRTADKLARQATKQAFRRASAR